jgi:6-phosphofructokinase 1
MELLVDDRNQNPSHYSIVAVSEGAKMISEGDNKKLGSGSGQIGQVLKRLIPEYHGVNTIYQHLGYLLRSGYPDSLDVMVSMNFASVAIDLINQSRFGLMTSVRDGKYAFEPIDTFSKGIKRVDTDKYYDSQKYIPKIQSLSGEPLFLR